MLEMTLEALSEQLQGGGEGPLVLDIRHEEEFEEWHNPGSLNGDVYDELPEAPEQATEGLSDIPDHPQKFERVNRTKVGQESVPADELADLELGPNNCAAE